MYKCDKEDGDSTQGYCSLLLNTNAILLNENFAFWLRLNVKGAFAKFLVNPLAKLFLLKRIVQSDTWVAVYKHDFIKRNTFCTKVRSRSLYFPHWISVRKSTYK